MQQINWNASKDERAIITKIALRERELSKKAGIRPRPMIQVEMDVLATHLNGNPLRLEELLAADDFNFSHDICGIARHLDRETGKLTNCFRPRFSVPARSSLDQVVANG